MTEMRSMTRGRQAGLSGQMTARGFVADAQRQMDLAAAAPTRDEAVVYLYRAALRAAGALIQERLAGRKRRPTGSAWQKLRKLRPDLGAMIDTFERHARLASRANLGLEQDLSPEAYLELLADVQDIVALALTEVSPEMQVA